MAKKGRKPSVVEGKRHSMIVRLDVEIAEDLGCVADELGVSVNSIINEAARLWLERNAT